MCRSELSIDAGGFAFGATFAGAPVGAGAGADAGAAGVAPVSAGFAPGSLILLLENISCSLDVDHWVYRFSADPNLIVKVSPGGLSGVTHISNVLSTRDPLANLYADV